MIKLIYNRLFIFIYRRICMKKIRILLLSALVSGAAALCLTSCGVLAPVGTEHQHTEKNPIRENEIAATCTAEGSYDEVVYCKSCNEELSRTTVTVEIDPEAHTADEPTIKNEIPATCDDIGHRDEVTYCKDCGTELDRKALEVPKISHNLDGTVCTFCSVEVAENGIEYKLNSDGLGYTLVSVGSFAEAELVIDSFNGLPVTKIADRAFCKNETLTTLTLSATIQSIGWGAFLNCNALTAVSFDGTNSDWQYVNVGAYNSSLTSAEFTFKEPEAPEIPEIPEDDSSSVGLTFKLNEDKNSYTLTSVGSCLDKVVRITTYKGLPVTHIAPFAFTECDEITEVYISKEVISIGNNAFEKCFSLRTLTFEEGSKLESIGNSAFFLCDSLHDVTLPDSLKVIDDLAFVMCHHLQSIRLGTSLESIGNNAFYGCFKLVEIINHSQLTITLKSSTNGCVALYALDVHTENASKIIMLDDFRFYAYQGMNHLLCYDGTETEIVLPESFYGENYGIHDFAFYNKNKITSITFSSAVERINEGAFMWCTSLVNLDMSRLTRVSVIGDEAFYGCANLETVVIPNCVQTISYKAFDKCLKLKEITLGTGVTLIEDGAFCECELLETVTALGNWEDITVEDRNPAITAARDAALAPPPEEPGTEEPDAE